MNFLNQFFAKVANPFPKAIMAIPNSSSEIPVAKKDVAQPAYTASPNPFRQITNPKAIAIKLRYASIDLVVVPFKKSPPPIELS